MDIFNTSERSAQSHLLGRVDYDVCLALQRRLAYEAGGHNVAGVTILICEHPRLITVGRDGSRGHIRLSGEQLRRRQLDVRWVARNGGCVLHGPGQLAVYPIIPLSSFGWNLQQVAERLRRGIAAALAEIGIRSQTVPGNFGLWGRSGQLASIAPTVVRGVTYHGAFVNVNPMMSDYAFVDSLAPEKTPPGSKSTMGCLLSERRYGVRMPAVRSTLVQQLANALDCPRYHVWSGHPLLARYAQSNTSAESTCRAS